LTIHDEIVAGETIVTRWTASGTHHGDLPGIPRTGKSLSVTGITIARMKNGKFVESWNNWDALGLMQQLGAIAPPASGRAA
jgi:predicted ester cyclase